MKAVTVIILVATLGLAGCHAHRDKETPPAPSAPGVSPATAKSDKALEKSRDAMLGKDMDIGSQHWATSPAAASTAPVAATAASGPAAASSAPRAGKH
ncbi:hypothetical protein QMK61_06865 [Fulvimonas sp. R45]|uniref:hypothetical protein n=1 Tax=Fulvimonas sp. R45 TaxID=3045937 RepID=UPI00265EC0B1|nr:hypothetical protein [Fulvimonas sp. R45]MDO1528556.1 hypothetical protein [Fulvimonas sp. R45]